MYLGYPVHNTEQGPCSHGGCILEQKTDKQIIMTVSVDEKIKPG